MTTLLFTHLACFEHDTGEFHPECPDRLKAISRVLEHEEFSFLIRADAPEATLEQLHRAHSPEHVAYILDPVPEGQDYRYLDQDTVISRGTRAAALRSAGAVCAAVDAVMAGEARNAFCLVRPPGHHAEREEAMGFCLFSNCAIGALHARDAHGLKRVAVVDFDAHHGNGTQSILWDEPGMFYASTHQDDAFPYTGAATETGGPGGAEVVNVPMPAGAKSEDFRSAFADCILPRLEDFAPELIILSTGFDAHAADGMSYLRLQVSDFDWATRQVMAIAGKTAQHRVVSVLEGGYELRALAACTAAHLRILMGG
jgi:acetoin utilization deacetylase AcuC-like enzyme